MTHLSPPQRTLRPGSFPAVLTCPRRVLGPAARRAARPRSRCCAPAAAAVLRRARDPLRRAGPGYYALVRHADILEASRNPEVFCSGQGATSIPDLPAEFTEYFGSMINMDDPRHARLRRIVSRAFTPRMIKQFEDDVQPAAAADRGRPAGDGAGATSSSTWPPGCR